MYYRLGPNGECLNNKAIFMYSRLFFIYATLLSSSGFAQEDLKTYQKEVIAKLTRKEAIKESLYLNQRATYKERSLTANYLAEELKNAGWTCELQKYRTPQSNYFLDLFFRPNKGVNVIGKLSASHPTKRHIILGAHYDTERNTPGAIDNASGVALCLALAKMLRRLDHRKYNVLVVFFDQEEDDEVGSEVFVEMIQKTKLDVHSVHIFDLIGWDTDGDSAITLQSSSSEIEDHYLSKARSLGIPIKIIGGASSDNKPFVEVGYPTIHPFEEMEDSTPHYHSPQDTYETVNFQFLANSTLYVSQVLTKILEDN